MDNKYLWGPNFSMQWLTNAKCKYNEYSYPETFIGDLFCGSELNEGWHSTDHVQCSFFLLVFMAHPINDFDQSVLSDNKP